MKARDLFAGAGGWDLAAEELGWSVDGWEILPEAQETRAAAGLKTAGSDVRDIEPAPGEYDVEIASPPCQSFSMAGKGTGRAALGAVLTVITSYREGRPMSYAEAAALTGDERTALVAEPLRVALGSRPQFIAWEQVPAVLPVWEACAVVLREHGYSVAVGTLNSEQYGVPQTRRRAVLVARRDGGTAQLPKPTHSRYYQNEPSRLDPGVLPWVSMAAALGWGMTARPSMTVTGGGTDTGGAEPFGNGARVSMRRELTEGRWALRNGSQANATERGLDQPSGTLFFGEQSNWVAWVQRSNYSSGSSDGSTAAERGRTTRGLDQPSVTITGKGFSWAEGGDPAKSAGLRVTITEAAVLQTFPADHPFQGSKGRQYLQIGNAIPPRMALAILRAITATPGQLDPAWTKQDRKAPRGAQQPSLFGDEAA